METPTNIILQEFFRSRVSWYILLFLWATEAINEPNKHAHDQRYHFYYNTAQSTLEAAPHRIHHPT